MDGRPSPPPATPATPATAFAACSPKCYLVLLALTLTTCAPSPTYVDAARDNCIAGGSSHGVSFDRNRADTIGLLGSSLPKDALTVEYWYRNTDLNADYATLHCYSAYNVRGFQGGLEGEQETIGKATQPYEGANEVQFGFSPGFLRLWRGTDITDLRSEVNPKAATLTTDWRHYAFSVGKDTAEISFYIDGEMMDFGYAAIELSEGDDPGALSGRKVAYSSLPYSSEWDVAESPDAVPYYGRHEVNAVPVHGEDACSTIFGSSSNNLGILFSDLNSTFENTTKAVAMVWRSDSKCDEYHQARNLAEAGAWAVIFEEMDKGGSEGGGEDEGGEEGSLPDATEEAKHQPALSIPVLSVSAKDFASLEKVSSFTVTRTKSVYKLGTDVAKSIERNGVLHLGQEPDKAWADFDETQAANGVLDEYRVWSTIRTPEQIRENYRRSIDPQSEDAKELAVYWKFDEEPRRVSETVVSTVDSAPGNANPGLLGSLPTVKNEISYVTARGKVPPTSPERIPTTSSPIVGDGEVVVPVLPGADHLIELKSFDPDGDDLVTQLTTEPSSGILYTLVTEEGTFGVGSMLSSGDEVEDIERTESKRVVYRARDDFSRDVIFTFTVSDGGTPVEATVRLILHQISQPKSRSVTIAEDTLTPFSLAMPSQLDQKNMKVEITSLPERGQLYQAQFDPSAYPAWTALAKTVGQYGPMVKIDSVGDILNTDRGIVMFHPDKDGYSSSPDDIYATFKYRFIDPSGLKSSEAGISVVTAAVNDPPIGMPATVSIGIGDEGTYQLHSTDVDADALEVFAERTFARIVSFPSGGEVYQYDEQTEGGRGVHMDPSIKDVPQTFAWASRVLRYSSQFTLCGDSCFTWNDPECPMNDVLSGGSEDGTCSETSWHASMILGPPDFWPGYADTKLGWDLSSENAGHEFIELEYPHDVYISSFELYETFKPGSLWRVSTADNYTDDTDVHCTGQNTRGVPECSMDTDWLTLWTKPRGSVAPLGDTATVTAPPLCPSTIKTRVVRLDFDTSQVPGWNNFDAAKVTGSLDPPPGLLFDTSNRFMYVPHDGVHGVDKLWFTVTDCLDEGEESEFAIAISTPKTGDFSPSVFSTEIAVLDTTVGTVLDYNIDLTDVLVRIKAQTGKDPLATGIVWHTTALGARAGDTFKNISLSNDEQRFNISLGTKTVLPSKLELWLEDESALTFRLHITVKIHIECEHGTVDESRGICVCTSPRWVGSSCSVEMSENRNEIPPGIKGAGYIMFAINFLLISVCFLGVKQNQEKREVRKAQPFFLYLLLFGCLLVNSTIAALQIEGSNFACHIRPWLWSLGFSIMFGSLFAKILRVYKLFKNGRAMRRKEITIRDTMRPVVVIITLNAIILICWTAIDPLEWIRITQRDDGYGYTLSSVGLCDSQNETPYLASLGGINGLLMIVASYLSYKARNIPSDFQEGKYVMLAVFSCIEVYFIGVPVMMIVGSDPSISDFVQSAIIFLTTFAVVLLIFGPLLWKVYRGEQEAELDSVYSIGSREPAHSRPSSQVSIHTTSNDDRRLDTEASTSRKCSNDMNVPMLAPMKKAESGEQARFEELRDSRRRSNESNQEKFVDDESSIKQPDSAYGDLDQGNREMEGNIEPIPRKNCAGKHSFSNDGNSQEKKDVTHRTSIGRRVSFDGSVTGYGWG